MSGGSGTRLWPLSREHFPKQLLPVAGDRSLLQQTVMRVSPVVTPAAAPLIVCNEEHRFLVAEQLLELGSASLNILLEPVGRNTAPALTVAALRLEAQQRDPVMLVMPADHVVQNQDAFNHAVEVAAAVAQAGALVTFGITPTGPETGYGYIRAGRAFTETPQVHRVADFVEKPDRDTAQAYLDSGDYLWNSGMFVMRASIWLNAVARYQAKMLAACREAVAKGRADTDFYRLHAESFKACPSDSIDYAVMEKIAGARAAEDFSLAVVELDAGWSDVGAWSAVWEVGGADADGNVAKGDVITHGSTNNLLVAEHRLVAGVGLDNMIVIETADAVMVAPKDRAQDVKHIVAHLRDHNRRERLFHRRVYRPWGHYEGMDRGERFQVKRITVKPGASLSMQMHHHRAEHWIVVSGTARVTRGGDSFLLSENQSTYIPIGEKHRLENPGTLPLELIEVQSGSYLGEDDIVRFDDKYGRD